MRWGFIAVLAVSTLAARLAAQPVFGRPLVASRGGVVASADPDGTDHARTVALAVTPQGLVIAVQPRDGHVRVYSTRGGAPRTLGANGSGPGEFLRPVAAGSLGDTLWIYDSALQRVSFYSATLVHLKSVLVTTLAVELAPATTTRVRNGALTGLLRDGSLLVSVNVGDPPPPPVSGGTANLRAELAHVRKGRDRELIRDTVRYLRTMTIEAAHGSLIQLHDPLPDLDRVVVDQTGAYHAILSVDSSSSRPRRLLVDLFDARGVRRYSQSLPCPARALTREEVDSEVASVAEAFRANPDAGEPAVNSYRRVIASRSTAPCIRRALVAEDGSVWVQTDKVPQERWVRLSPNGAAAVEVRFRERANRRILHAGVDRLWAVETDDDEVSTLTWYAVSAP